jgi:DNA invertase Pin-like site-specific DNA recombinase
MTALAYTRVSTQEQASSGLGLEAQRASIAAAAQRMGLTVAAWHADEGVSGAAELDKRPGLVAAMDALGRGDVLLVAKRDRLARDVFMAVWLDREAERKGARIVSAAGEGTETDDAAAVLLRRMLDAVAEFERAQIRARTRAALEAKRARGERLGGVAPYGYRREGVGLVKEPAEMEVLCLVRKLRRGGLSAPKIARSLQEQGRRPRLGRKWTAKMVRDLLRAMGVASPAPAPAGSPVGV